MDNKVIFGEPGELEESELSYKVRFPYTITDQEEPNFEDIEKLYFIDIEVGFHDKIISKLNGQELIDTMLAYAEDRGMDILNNPERYYKDKISANDISRYSHKKPNE